MISDLFEGLARSESESVESDDRVEERPSLSTSVPSVDASAPCRKLIVCTKHYMYVADSRCTLDVC